MNKTSIVVLSASAVVLAGAAVAAPLGARLNAPAAVAAQAAALTAADQARVDQARAYLQGLKSVKGRFAQTDAAGRVTRGAFYLQRPGKIRFEYDGGTMLIVSDGGNVAVQDNRLKTFNRYPLSSTPLSLFLAKEIRLDRGVVVDRVNSVPGGFVIGVRDAKKEAPGRVNLTFSSGPVVLKEWVVVDPQGRTTRVALSGLEPASFDPKIFVLRNPARSARS